MTLVTDLDIMRIAHADHLVAAPVAIPVVQNLLRRLAPEPSGRVVDLGCGPGEWLLQLLAGRPDLSATGIDLHLPEDLHDRAEQAGVAQQVTWIEADISTWAENTFDVAMCVGASDAFGGLDGTLDALRRVLRPGGRALLGDTFWEVAPSTAAQEVLGAGPDDFPDLAGLLDLVRAHGFEPGYGHVSTLEEWDEYEWSWTGSLVSWGLRPERDQVERDTVLAMAADHREGWLRGYREQLGFVTVVLYDTQS